LQIKNILHQTYIIQKGDAKGLEINPAQAIAGPVKQDISRKSIHQSALIEW